MNDRFGKKRIILIISILAWVALWEAASLMIGSSLILPGPAETAGALVRLALTRGFWLDAAWTMARVLAGALISIIAGSACALYAAKSKAFREFLTIPVSFFKSIPVMAIIIYVILIVKADCVAVVVCFLMCFPIAYTNMLKGITGHSREYDELASMLGISSRMKWSIIVRPELHPVIRASVELIAGMSWKVVVAAEVLAIPAHSIGYQMLNSKYYLETADLFAYIVVLIVFSLAVEKLAVYTAETDYRHTGARVRRAALRAETSSMKKKPGGSEACADNGTVSSADSDKNEGLTVRFLNVDKRYDSESGKKKEVLIGSDLTFRPGVTAILGPSGAGKTTIVRLISGLERPDSGIIRIEAAPDASVRCSDRSMACSGPADRDESNSDERSRRYKEQQVRPALLFQEDRLLPWLTAEENLLMAFAGEDQSRPDAESGRGGGFGGSENKNRAPMDERSGLVRKMAEKLELSDALDKKPDELSGGMAHRVALGRALLSDSRLLILDEPMRGLNEELKWRVLENVGRDLSFDPYGRRRTTILVTHDEELAEKTADTIVRI